MNKSLRKELGYNKYNEILPNRKVKKKDTETKRKVESEIKKYGYPKSDLWSMDATSAIWLLEHLEMYLEIVGEFVDLNYHTFEIPILIPDEDVEKKVESKTEKPDHKSEDVPKQAKFEYKKHYKEKIVTLTQK